MLCLPGVTTAALFIAFIMLDLHNRDWARVPGHALFGVFAVLLMLFICERAGEGTAWLLLIAPFLFVGIGYIIRKLSASSSSSNNPVIPADSNGCNAPCRCCMHNPCRCLRPCPKQRECPDCPGCPDCPDCPKCPKCPKCPNKPKPKPDSCIPDSLA